MESEDLKGYFVTFVTPKKYVLHGLWFGPEKPEKVLVCVHGLGSNMFSNHSLFLSVVNEKTAVFVFNNRGHDKISGIRKLDKRKKRGFTGVWAGESHEIFTESEDDIQGAINCVKSKGAKEIYLFGHSTGSQKSVYYLSKRGNQKKVRGLILSSPMSDYAGALKFDVEGKLSKAEKVARKMIEEGRSGDLLPQDVWGDVIDAQRLISLYTPDSPEEIFSYVKPENKSKLLRKIKIPTLVILGQKDEYKDRPINKLVKWFDENMRMKQKKIVVIKDGTHSFLGKEREVSLEIFNWVNI